MCLTTRRDSGVLQWGLQRIRLFNGSGSAGVVVFNSRRPLKADAIPTPSLIVLNT